MSMAYQWRNINDNSNVSEESNGGQWRININEILCEENDNENNISMSMKKMVIY